MGNIGSHVNITSEAVRTSSAISPLRPWKGTHTTTKWHITGTLERPIEEGGA